MPYSIEEKNILQSEEELNFVFPKSFKEKMQKENGGVLFISNEEWLLYPFFDNSDKRRIKRTSNHIVLETHNAKQWDSFPRNGIAIAGNGFGDQLIFLVNNSQNIFVWRHDSGLLSDLGLISNFLS
jgi:hypothetical protein